MLAGIPTGKLGMGQETLDAMTFYDLIVIEEVGQLSKDIFERLLRLWDAAGNRPTLLFVGDFAQLRGVENTRACDSWRWAHVTKHRLITMRRCKCRELRRKLELLRSAKPTKKQLSMILRGHKAPSQRHRGYVRMQQAPSQEDVAWIYEETPHTTFVTITRSASRSGSWPPTRRRTIATTTAASRSPGSPSSCPSSWACASS